MLFPFMIAQYCDSQASDQSLHLIPYLLIQTCTQIPQINKPTEPYTISQKYWKSLNKKSLVFERKLTQAEKTAGTAHPDTKLFDPWCICDRPLYINS